MTLNNLMWAVTAASLVGAVANVYKRRWCFGVWLGTNLAWAGYDIWKDAPAQAALMAVYAGISAWGLVHWRGPSMGSGQAGSGRAKGAGGGGMSDERDPLGYSRGCKQAADGWHDWKAQYNIQKPGSPTGGDRIIGQSCALCGAQRVMQTTSGGVLVATQEEGKGADDGR